MDVEFMDAYLDGLRAAGAAGDLGQNRVAVTDALRMVKRRAKAAGLSAAVSCNMFQVTGIIAYLENAGTIENAQAIAAHERPRTTKPYDRTDDTITLDEVERIAI